MVGGRPDPSVAAYDYVIVGEGTLKERLDDVAASFADNPIVQEIVAYIRADRKKALCTPRDASD